MDNAQANNPAQRLPIQDFLDQLAGKQATPGGGGAAALAGAMGAALVSMVANFTIAKKGYEQVETEARAMLEKAEALRAKLTAAVEEDAVVFKRLMSAYAMPGDTTAEQTTRAQTIQSCLRHATDVPLQCAVLCHEVIELCHLAAEKGNKNVISDAGVAALMGYAGLKSAALNVYINIGRIKDETFVADRGKQLEELLAETDQQTALIYTLVKNKIIGTP